MGELRLYPPGILPTEFLLAETERKFMIAKKAHSWGNKELFDNFAKCLKGQVATIWEEVFADKYPDEDALTTHEFDKPEGALDAFHTRLLNCKNGRDVMLRYLERNVQKDPFGGSVTHLRRFKEVLRHAMKLPKGNKTDPNEAEIVEWYYLSFCQAHRKKYLAAGLTLKNTSLEKITEFMRLQMENDLKTGVLTRLRRASRARRSDRRRDCDRRRDDSHENRRRATYRGEREDGREHGRQSKKQHYGREDEYAGRTDWYRSRSVRNGSRSKYRGERGD
jgi:hypothetical protein